MRLGSAAFALAFLLPPASHAAVLYSFTGSYAVERDIDGTPTETQTLTFQVSAPASITAAGDLATLSCNTNDVRFTCSARGQTFDPNGFNTGYAFIGLNTDRDGGGGTGFYFFSPGAFLADGTHQTFNGDIQDPGGNGYGNAGAATLVVSGIRGMDVPEPASLALLAAGLAGFAAARRRA